MQLSLITFSNSTVGVCGYPVVYINPLDPTTFNTSTPSPHNFTLLLPIFHYLALSFSSFTSSLSFATLTAITLTLPDSQSGQRGTPGWCVSLWSESCLQLFLHNVLEMSSIFSFCSSSQADQRFVWNGNLLRDFAAQPEVLVHHSQMTQLFWGVIRHVTNWRMGDRDGWSIMWAACVCLEILATFWNPDKEKKMFPWM